MDEKNLGRAEKEARKGSEQQANKRRHGKHAAIRGQGKIKGLTRQASTSGLLAATPGVIQPPRQPKTVSGPLGPCRQCSAFGHLAASCTVSKQYPLPQPVVSSAEVSTLDKVELSLYDGGVNSVTAEPVTSNNFSAKLKASGQSVWYEGTDQQAVCPGSVNCFAHYKLDTSANVTKFWEAEGGSLVQITDVQAP